MIITCFSSFSFFLSSFLRAKVRGNPADFRIFLSLWGILGKEVKPVILSYLRTALLHLILILVIRLMGKRQIGQMEPSEFVVTMLVANLAAIPMQDSGIPLLSGLVPILTVLGIELVLSTLSPRSVRLRKLLCGKPVILIENGRILQENLRKTSITLDELTGHLRLKDVLDLKAVQFAILETDGNLSVFPYPKHRPANASEAGIPAKPQYLPITIIGDGHLYRDNLQLLGKDEAWVNRVLSERSATIATTWLLTCDKTDQICFYPKEASQ
jgi:uncharacterized membrane protein YcaP (DUF421 family)